MIRSRRAGFTLVEFLVVAVLAAIILGAVVQALVVQERTYRATGESVRGQDGLRIAIGVLETELREVATQTGPRDGSDIEVATRDSVIFRAHRKLGFVCDRSPNEKHITTWAVSAEDQFVLNTDVQFLVFRDGLNTATAIDDEWLVVQAQNVQPITSVACPSRPGGGNSHNRLHLSWPGGATIADDDMQGIWPGAPVRSIERITYGLYELDGGWALRRRAGNVMQTLVSGLAGRGEGLTFTYFDANGNPLNEDPVADPSQVAAISITATTGPPPGTGASPVELTTHIFLRNN
jgi:prepilin-type N-terminal cleavage/methylation domain-containing protein